MLLLAEDEKIVCYCMIHVLKNQVLQPNSSIQPPEYSKRLAVQVTTPRVQDVSLGYKKTSSVVSSFR